MFGLQTTPHAMYDLWLVRNMRVTRQADLGTWTVLSERVRKQVWVVWEWTLVLLASYMARRPMFQLWKGAFDAVQVYQNLIKNESNMCQTSI